ncbi:hypothetical protein SAMN05421770_11249 [Granulicella rosea]|uniref:Uncharacterized protein n=1 Tax=Granulicella rosea TaxID=474952 RepID=A0A239MF06_9BACT|nr:hypothetical protein [Granulicella rosea]SNT41627.1 hypothetical protein SAMN05421770_11249 [Granulicella rosea]
MKTKSLRRSAGTISTLLAAHLLAPALQAQANPRPAVELTQNGCAQVGEGDTISFDWNPGFDHAGGVTGMRRVFLLFAPRGEEAQAEPGRGGILLSATRSAERTGLHGSLHGSTIAAQPNGFYRVTFRPSLHGAEPGEYRLVDARVDARVDTRYRGARPEMTNNPVRSAYCLRILPADTVRGPVTPSASNLQPAFRSAQ